MSPGLPNSPSPRAAFGAVGDARFDNLLQIARQSVPKLPWEGRLQELALDPDAVQAAVTRTERPGKSEIDTVFSPFVGHWVGGDLHDARRAYNHIWYAPYREGDLLAQPVIMIAVASPTAPILAYNFARDSGETCELRGLVGQNAHVGFRLAEDTLLWVGEEPDGWVSVHVERVWARGQLYDIRGLVLRPNPEGGLKTRASDWRYHRVAAGAIELPTAL